jgi:hypothetical protein
VTKFKVRLVLLLLTWTTVFAVLYLMDASLFDKFFTIWAGIVFTTAILVLTHFHFKKWEPEIKNELGKHNLKLISERPLTFFETVQFADTRFFVEIVSFNFKQIIKVEDRTKELCIRITKNYLSDTIEKIEIIDEV